jgi:hypothetical protein
MSYSANTTIPNLVQATALSDSDIMVTNQGGVTKRVSVATVTAQVLSAKSLLSSTTNTDRVMVRRGSTTNDVELGSMLPAQSVGQTQLADNAVTGSKLQNSGVDDNARAVSTNHIRNRAVSGAKIGVQTILNENLGSSCVGETQLQPLSVSKPKLQAGAVGQSEIDGFTRSHFTVAGIRGEHRYINPWRGIPQAWSSIGNKSADQSVKDDLAATMFKIGSQTNRFSDWWLSSQECTPTFGGWTQASTTVGIADISKGGAYSGGVLLPDGRVFLVPYNAQPAVYDPYKDTLTVLPWPGGVPPFGPPYYAGYSGGALLAAQPAVAGIDGARAGANSPGFNDGPVVVCAPFYAKRALVFNVQTNTCSYGNTVSALPNRAFGGIVALGPEKTKSGFRAAVLTPHASGLPYLLTSAGTLVASASVARAAGYGASFNSNYDVTFGTFNFNAQPEDTVTSSWSSGNTDYPTIALRSELNVRMVSVNQTTGVFVADGNPNRALAKTPMPTGGAVGGYRVSGLVQTPDGWLVAVPGYWGGGHTPSILIFDPAINFTGDVTNPNEAFALPLSLQSNILASGSQANTPAPGNALFAGGVQLLDGRVFLLPCTSTKAYIISTRKPMMPFPEDLTLSPFINKR